MLASPVPATSTSRCVGWGETDDPYALIAAPAARRRAGSALANRMWAEQVLRVAGRAARRGADAWRRTVLGELRMRKTADEVDALRRGRPGDRPRARPDGASSCGPGVTEREAGRDDRRRRSSTRATSTVDFVIVGSGPNGASPHHEVGDRVHRGRRPGRRRHRRHHGRGLLLRLHPHVHRSASRRPSSSTYFRGAARGPAGGLRARPARGDRRVGRRGRPRRDRGRRLRRARSSTAPATASASRRHEEPYIVEGNDRCSSRAWRSRSSRASTCPAGTAPASRTSSSTTDGRHRAPQHHRPRLRRAGGLSRGRRPPRAVERQLPTEEAARAARR